MMITCDKATYYECTVGELVDEERALTVLCREADAEGDTPAADGLADELGAVLVELTTRGAIATEKGRWLEPVEQVGPFDVWEDARYRLLVHQLTGVASVFAKGTGMPSFGHATRDDALRHIDRVYDERNPNGERGHRTVDSILWS